MQNEDNQNRQADKKIKIDLDKSFLNFTLRNYITLYSEEIPKEMMKEWEKQKKFGIKILKYITGKDSGNNFIFANFLRYQMPLLIIQGKIKEKNLYFINLKELIEQEEFNFSVKSTKKLENTRNYITLIGRQIAKKYGKLKENPPYYYGKKFFQNIVPQIQEIKKQKNQKPDEILEQDLNELLSQEQCIERKKKLEKMINKVKKVIKKIKFNPQKQ